MGEWLEKRMEEIAEFNPRETIKKGTIAKKIAMDKIQPFCRDVPGFEMEAFSGGTKFRNGDTIMARITPCLENGKTARVDILDDGEVGFGSTEFIVFRAKDGYDPDFLYYLVTSPVVREPAIKSMVGSSGRQRVQTDVVQQLKIMIPDLQEQQAIGGLLRSLDDKIAANRMINENLLQQAAAIHKSWFYEYALNEGVMPSSWRTVTIEDITCLVSRGIAPKYDDDSDQIILNQKCIRNHTIDFIPSRRHIPKAVTEKWLVQGDLLINSTGQGTLGRVAQVWFEPKNMTVDSHITIVRPKSALLRNYIGFWGITHEAEIEALHTGSTGQTELPRERVKTIEIMLPDDNTLMKYNDVISPITQLIVANREEIERLSLIRDSLIPKLMSGELDVSDHDL